MLPPNTTRPDPVPLGQLVAGRPPAPARIVWSSPSAAKLSTKSDHVGAALGMALR